MQPDNKKTIIVGAGLAGLTCAKVLAESGAAFMVCEAANQPGGRVVSRKTSDGFILDRGFQVLLDSYPAARRHLDFAALGGGRFRAGALFVGSGKPQRLENPLRNPAAMLNVARQQVIPQKDLLRLAALIIESFLRRCHEISVADLLQQRAFSKQFMANFARPFFGGVLLDPSLGTSAALLLGYLRRFATGRALLPGTGIGAIGQQLADLLPKDLVCYDAKVAEILFSDGRASGVRLQNGEVLNGSHVVLATDEPSTCKLLGRGAPRAARSTAVHYFSSRRALYEGAWLCLPPIHDESTVLHAALLTNVAPTLAPSGLHLLSVTVTDDNPHSADSDWVAREVCSWFGVEAEKLKPIKYMKVLYAVPEQPPGYELRPDPWGELPPGVLVAGDAVCGASIDAAMASGEDTAKKVISSTPRN